MFTFHDVWIVEPLILFQCSDEGPRMRKIAGNLSLLDRYLERSTRCGFRHVSAAQFAGSNVCESSQLAFEFVQVLVLD